MPKRHGGLGLRYLEKASIVSGAKLWWRWVAHCHIQKFSLGCNGLITFSILMRVCQIDAKGQIIAKEENY